MSESLAGFEPRVATFSIVMRKQDALVAELERLAKRAARLGAPPITWSFGAVEQRVVRVRRKGMDPDIWGPEAYTERHVPFIALTLSGARPRIAGWEFVAAITHMDGVNVLRCCPGVSERADAGTLVIPDAFRTRGTACDHCELHRIRRDTYVMRSDAGAWKQVGSSCLIDFLGHESPFEIARYAELLATATSLCEGAQDDDDFGFGGGGGGSRGPYALIEYLACVAAEIRESGWVPKSKAVFETHSTSFMAHDRMCELLDIKRDRTVNDDDKALAAAAHEWALELGNGNGRLNDYLWNLHAIAKAGIVQQKTFGLAASLVPAFTKEQTKRRESATRAPSAHVGAIGDRTKWVLRLERHFSFETTFGWQTRYILSDEGGNVFTWKTSTGAEMTEGKQYIVTGSIKDHNEYNGTKQTVLSRCTVADYDAEVFAAWRAKEDKRLARKRARDEKAAAATARAEAT